ncbi:MAG TPA: MgtC/SapB family protein [Terriglobales bacterium]|nr:MgtC/SapB family protein [Terriglobales bacterium]
MPDFHNPTGALHYAGTVLSSTIARLVVAAILGGIIGLQRQLRHKPAGLRTNMFICFGSAMFTMLSDQLAGSFGGDHTRVAAQIIPGIGFIGAGSILHARGSVVGLTSAATIFVVASVGMATGGGLYFTAIFATIVILIALALLGRLENRLAMKSVLITYEVTGANAEVVLIESNRVLDQVHSTMQNVRVAGAPGHVRVLFGVDAPPEEQDEINNLLHQSNTFSSVASLGAVEHE